MLGFIPMRLSSGVRCSATRAPNSLAVITETCALNYAQLVDRINRVAATGQEHWQLERGDVVALVAENRQEYLEIVIGLSDIGVITATLSPAITPKEFQQIVSDCMPKRVILSPQNVELIETCQELGIPAITLGEQYEKQIAQGSSYFEPLLFDETDSFCLCYTSGTTGQPKGVLLSHRSRALTVQAMNIEYGCFSYDDHFLALAPFCHGAGFAFALAAISFGGCLQIAPTSKPEYIVEKLASGDISGVFMVPTHFNRIFSLQESILSRMTRNWRVKTVISNAAALSMTNKVKSVEYFGEGILHETYGSTEAGVVTNMRPQDLLRKGESVGMPFINTEIEVRREDGSVCDHGEIGELFSRAPYTFNGYLNRVKETEETIQNGWVSVKDLAIKDEDGFIYIRGRMKDMVVSGGINIYPVEIENVIAKVDGVKEVAVVGVADEEWGERVHAFIVPERDATPNEDFIIELCRKNLSAHKIPRGISLINELPRNPSGKILKRELRV